MIWYLGSFPTGEKTIWCKWVFAIKVNLDRSIACLKARLVAKGYAHTYEIDYFDLFSPITVIHFYGSISRTAFTLKMPFSTVIFKRKYTWRNHLGLLLKRRMIKRVVLTNPCMV